MVIAFWNVNTGRGSFKDRIGTLETWCARRQPDLLLLEEVSADLVDQLPGLTGMTPLGYANTLNKNLKKSTKQLHALAKKGLQHDFACRANSFPGLEAKRLLLKVTAPSNKQFALWSIHANASPKGGAAAVKAVNDYLDKRPGAIVGGDFNRSIVKAGGRALKPKSWQRTNLRLTQWKKRDGATRAPNAPLHLVNGPSYGPVINAEIVANKVIDYLMVGGARKATAVPNCGDEVLWRDILTFFDHCPVVYNVDV